MRIAIIGADAMGSVYAYCLSQKNDVTLLDASFSRVNDLQTNGLRIMENGVLLKKPCRARSSSHGLDVFDLVILFVKAIHTTDALIENHGILGSKTTVLSLQNGYGAWERISQVCSQTVLCGISMHGATMRQDGIVVHTASGATVFGSPEQIFLPAELAAVFSECGLQAKAVWDIRQEIWRKLIINAGINGVTALLYTNNAHLAQCRYASEVSKQLVHEATQAAADGCHFDPVQMAKIVHDTAVYTGENLSSMLQDILYRRKTEADVIYEPILRLSHANGLQAPYTSAVYALIKSLETAIESGHTLR